MNVEQCTKSICTFYIPVEFYVPLNVSAVGLSDLEKVTETVYWSYPVIVNPHVVPQTLWDLYHMSGNPLVTNSSATQSVVEFEEQYYKTPSLDSAIVLVAGKAHTLPSYDNRQLLGPFQVNRRPTVKKT